MSSRKRRSATVAAASADVLQTDQRPEAAAEWFSPTNLNPWVLPVCLAVLTILAYLQVFSCGFIEAYDDEEYVTRNMFVLQGLTWHGFTWSMTSFLTGNWHPLTWWSHMADVSLFGLNPAGHHATNLAIHVFNTILLYTLLARITGFRGRCFLVAALFAVHPLHVESVAWVAERKDVLSTMFGLVALHYYVQYVHTYRKVFYLAMFASVCLSLMAKPMLVTFPCMLLVLDYWPLARFRERSFTSLVREKIPLFLPVMAISALAIVAQRSVDAIATRPFLSRIYGALNAYVVYLRKFFVPHDLSSFYPYVPVSMLQALSAVLFLLTLSILAWWYRSRVPWFLAGWLLYLGLLVPVVGLIGVGAQAYADRYMYLPAVGVSIMAVWLLAGVMEKMAVPSWIRLLCTAVAIAGCMLLTWKQTGFWKDGFSLYGRELAVLNGNWHAHLNLGTMLVERKRYDEGIAHYENALINGPPSEASIYHNLGVAYERKGDQAQALSYFRRSIHLAPARDRGYLGVARVLSTTGDMAGALSVIREGSRNVPDNWLLLAKEAYLLHSLGNIDAAEKVYRQAIAKEPFAVQNYVNLGILLMQQQNRADFDLLAGQLRKINPSEADNLVKMFK